MPTDFMYVSKAGIPHILKGYASVKEADNEVAKFDAEFTQLRGSEPCGDSWAGMTLDNGVARSLARRDVVEALGDKFDPEAMES